MITPTATNDNPVCCPFCGSEQTEPLSLFGQQLLTAQYYCTGCHTPFEKVRDSEILNDFACLERTADKRMPH